MPSALLRAPARANAPQPAQERLGLAGVTGLMLPGTAAYGAPEAASELTIADCAPVPPTGRTVTASPSP